MHTISRGSKIENNESIIENKHLLLKYARGNARVKLRFFFSDVHMSGLRKMYVCLFQLLL